MHRHTFEPHPSGTLARDHVHYEVLGGWLVNKLIVERDGRRIFEYRRAQLKLHFETISQGGVGLRPRP